MERNSFFFFSFLYLHSKPVYLCFLLSFYAEIRAWNMAIGGNCLIAQGSIALDLLYEGLRSV